MNRKQADDYPNNLMLALGVIPSSNAEYRNQQTGGLLVAFDSLEKREVDILLAIYRDGKTRAECSKMFGISSTRISQIHDKTLAKLKQPARLDLITYGSGAARRYKDLSTKLENLDRKIQNAEIRLAALMNRIELLENNENVTPETVADSAEALKNIPLCDLKLSRRAYNALYIAGIRDLYTLRQCTYDDLVRIRNMGAKTLSEVIEAAKKYGIEFIKPEE